MRRHRQRLTAALSLIWTVRRLSRLRHVIGAIFALVFACAVLSCGVVVSFDDYGVTAHAVTPEAGVLFAVGGTVSGLETERATLVLAGTTLDVGDGPFTFPATLADGIDFEVTIRSPAQHVCSISNARGRIVSADAKDVAVICVSRDATLAGLTVSPGALSLPFAPGTLSYRARVRARNSRPGGPATAPPPSIVTATASKANAQVSIGGHPSTKGTSTEPVTLGLGANPSVDITVTAPDDNTLLRYALTLSVDAYDRLRPGLPLASTNFGGGGIAASGNTVVVGADDGAYVFVRDASSTWMPSTRLGNAPTGPAPVKAVALDGDTLAVVGNDSIVLFERNATSWSTKLAIGPLQHESNLAAALDGDTLAVATCEAVGGPVVYVFTRASGTWSQPVLVRPTGHPAGDRCATVLVAPISVALSGDRLALGVTSDASAATGIDGDQNDVSLPSSGAVHVFTRAAGAWAQEAYIKATIPQQDGLFGNAIALQDTTLVVGSLNESSGGELGAVYVYTRSSTWTPTAHLRSGQSGEVLFGTSVALHGDVLAAGAPGASAAGRYSAGLVFAYGRNGATWSPYAVVSAPSATSSGAFGTTIGLTDDALFAAALLDRSGGAGINGEGPDVPDPTTGAAYVF